MQCYRHPKVETFLACGRCEKPICIKCAVSGPAGMRCRDCASLKSTALYKVNPGRLILAFAIGLIVCIIGSEVLRIGGFFTLLIGSAYGGFISEVILRIVGRKRGTAVEIVGMTCIIGGALIVFGYHFVGTLAELKAMSHNPNADLGPEEGMTLLLSTSVWQIIGTVIAAGVCYARLRE